MGSIFSKYEQAVENLNNEVLNCREELSKTEYMKILAGGSSSNYIIIKNLNIKDVGDKAVYDYNIEGAGVTVTQNNGTITNAIFNSSLVVSNVLTNQTQNPGDDCAIYEADSGEIESIAHQIRNQFI